MKPSKLHDSAIKFIAYLRQYQDDRGALANLRGALSDVRKPNAWPLLAGYPGAIGGSAYETVAALWASDPHSASEAGCLGETLARLKTDNNSFEGRFKRLLTCDREEIAARVAPVVRAAQAKGVGVNYTRLLSDLIWWNDGVKVEWAKAFWGGTGEEEVAG